MEGLKKLSELVRDMRIGLFAERIKEAVYLTAARNPAGIPYVKEFHLERCLEFQSEDTVDAVKKELRNFY